MRLKVFTASGVTMEKEITKISYEGEQGHRTLLEHHIDVVAALAPGIVTVHEHGDERFIAVAEAILVKIGARVRISARDAVALSDLERAQQEVQQRFNSLGETDKQLRSALVRLETGLARHAYEYEKEQ